MIISNTHPSGVQRDEKQTWSYRERLLLVAWFIGWTALSAANLFLLYDDVVTRDFEVFGSDGTDTVRMLAGDNQTLMDVYKHPLFALAGGSLYQWVSGLTGTDQMTASVITLSLICGLAMTLVTVLLRQHFGRQSPYWLGGSFFGFSFSTLVIFGIPETYCVTMTLLLGSLIVFDRFRTNLTSGRALLLGGIIGAAGLGNVTLLTMGMIPAVYLLLTADLRETMARSLLILAASVTVYAAVVLLLFGTSHFSFSQEYGERWFRLDNFLSLRQILSVLVQFFIFPVVGPGEALQELYSSRDVVRYLKEPLALVALGGYTTLLARSLWCARRQTPETGLALAAWMIVLIFLYVGFNAAEAILYSVQVLPVITFMIMSALRYPLAPRWLARVAAATVLCMALHNLFLIHQPALVP